MCLHVYENEAFWQLGRAIAETAAMAHGIALVKHGSLFDTLFSIIKQHSQCDDRRVVQILSNRLLDKPDETGAALLDCEEAIDVLERDDHKKVTEAQENHHKNQAAHNEFVEFYSKRKKEVDLFAEQSAPKKGAGKGRTVDPNRHKVPSTIDQSTAKAFLPPDSAIWKDNGRGEWNGRCPPYKRVYASWVVDGEDLATKKVIKMVWLQYAKLNVLQWPDCCPFAAQIDVPVSGE